MKGFLYLSGFAEQKVRSFYTKRSVYFTLLFFALLCFPPVRVLVSSRRSAEPNLLDQTWQHLDAWCGFSTVPVSLHTQARKHHNLPR